MVSQSASEINVAFLVDNAELEPAVRALHDLLLE
jgi:aspartokinase